jgi:hypothetical protein
LNLTSVMTMQMLMNMKLRQFLQAGSINKMILKLLSSKITKGSPLSLIHKIKQLKLKITEINLKDNF